MPRAISDRAFSIGLAFMGIAGYVVVVRLASVGFNAHLYTAFGDYVNANGHLPPRGVTVGADQIAANYADFPGLSLRIYQLLALAGVEPNPFSWALWLVAPLTIVAILFAQYGDRTGLSKGTARATSVVALTLGIVTARGFEDKAHFFWVPALAILAAVSRPWLAAVSVGIFTGWTGATALSPLLFLTRQPRHRLLLAGIVVVTAVVVLFAAGPETLTLIANRRDRESGATFQFGFWQLIPFADTAAVRIAFGLVMGLGAVIAYARGWIPFPAALTFMAVMTIAASPSFGHVRYAMLMPLGTYLLRSARGRGWYLTAVLVWGLVPLADLLRYGSMFADEAMTPTHHALVVAYTSLPILLLLVLFAVRIPWQNLGRRETTTSML
jgi:hypothetical protein